LSQSLQTLVVAHHQRAGESEAIHGDALPMLAGPGYQPQPAVSGKKVVRLLPLWLVTVVAQIMPQGMIAFLYELGR